MNFPILGDFEDESRRYGGMNLPYHALIALDATDAGPTRIPFLGMRTWELAC